MNVNPPYRYAAIPVELPRGQYKDVLYVVRMKSKEQAIKAVANWVDPESIIDVGATRTFDTKKQATAQAKARHTIYLDATKLSEGASPSTAEPVEEKAANPVRKLKNKLLR